jgi:uncharacterized protein YkwD
VPLLRRALALAFAVAAIGVGSSANAAALTTVERSVEAASEQADLIALVNAYRAGTGLQEVTPNGALTAAAVWMARDMAARNYIGHVSSDGRSPTQRMSAFGYPATSMYTGEDLGAGYGTAGAVFAGWQASTAHNAVLLNPYYNAIGIGLVYEPSSTYRWHWAADFGGPGGTVKIILPSPPQPEMSARAATAPRRSAPQATQDALTQTAAVAARTAFIEALAARRIAHLFAVLARMGVL